MPTNSKENPIMRAEPQILAVNIVIIEKVVAIIEVAVVGFEKERRGIGSS